MHGNTWRVLAASLVLAGLSAGAGGQSSGQLGIGAGDGTSEGTDAGAAALSPGSGADDELLFVGGPREPGVLSEAGTLIGAGAGVPELSPEHEDAVSGLVASALGDKDVSAPLGKLAEPEEGPRKGVRNLLRSLGSFLGLARDS